MIYSAGMDKILIIDDDVQLLEALKMGLNDYFMVECVSDPTAALQRGLIFHPDAILLDAHMGEVRGMDLLRQFREQMCFQKTPILILTGDPKFENQSEAFALGADDFILKPVSIQEIGLRLRARIQRTKQILMQGYRLDDLVVNAEKKEVMVGADVRRLSPLEVRLLNIFMLNPNRSISRFDLISSIWGPHEVSNRTLDVHVSTLRKKLKGCHYSIESIYKTGYIFRELDRS